MHTLKLENINNFVVISDVHLKDPADDLSALFIKTIDSLTHTQAVFLLGDIFDFIAASSPYFFKMWANVFLALRQLKEKGTAVYFIEGNHDFGFQHFKCDFLDSCFTQYGDFNVELHHKKIGIVQLSHGDNIVCNDGYLKFRSFVKQKFFQKCASALVPGFLMQFIFSRYAKLSRKKDKYRVLKDNFLLECIHKFIQKTHQLNLLIIGHIHVTKDFSVENKVRFISGPDWPQRPTMLVCDESLELRRVELT